MLRWGMWRRGLRLNARTRPSTADRRVRGRSAPGACWRERAQRPGPRGRGCWRPGG